MMEKCDHESYDAVLHFSIESGIISILRGEENRSSDGMRDVLMCREGETSESMRIVFLACITSVFALLCNAVQVVVPQEAAR